MDRFYRILIIGFILYVVFVIMQICGHLNSQTDEKIIFEFILEVIHCFQSTILMAIISFMFALIIINEWSITSMKEFLKFAIITSLAFSPQYISLLIFIELFKNWIKANITQIVCIQLIAIQVLIIVNFVIIL